MNQLRVLLAAVAAALLLSAPSCARICDPGETQTCFCPGGTTSAQVCAEDGEGWQTCPCGPAHEEPADDDDAGSDDDDSSCTVPDDDDDDQVDCGDLVPCTGDPSICDDPANCSFDLGCTCVNFGEFEICMPLCETQDDCPWKDGEQMECTEEGYCTQ